MNIDLKNFTAFERVLFHMTRDPDGSILYSYWNGQHGHVWPKGVCIFKALDRIRVAHRYQRQEDERVEREKPHHIGRGCMD